MFCPKCGQQQLSEQVRFCSRCGFKLDFVKASLADDGEASTVPAPPRQRDINIGVALMFFGTLLTYGILMISDPQIGIAGALLILVVTLISLLLFSRPIMEGIYRLLSLDEPLAGQASPRRREMSFGAILMFVGTILSGCVASLARSPKAEAVLLFTVLAFFVLLLFTSHRIMRIAQDIVGEQDARTSNVRGPALLPAEDIAVTVTGTQGVTTGALAPPPSITEQTTNLLEKG